MSKKGIELAVNEALSMQRLALLRQRYLSGTLGMDEKRPHAWQEFGWPAQISYEMLVNLYERGGVAHGAVNKLVGTCWGTDPWVIQGDEEDESRAESPWERATKAVLRPRVWKAFSEADLYRLVGRWSGMVLMFRDNKALSDPVIGRPVLDRVEPVWAGALLPMDVDVALDSPTFGQPKSWSYTEQIGDHTRAVAIHPSRVFILGDWSRKSVGFLEPAYNALVSLEKVEGGSGESFLKNAARQIGVAFDKEVNLAHLASVYGVTLDELQQKFNEAAREINRGNDSMLITQGATMTPLTTTVADPEPTYNVNLQTVAAALDIPSKILTGMQTGERASTEDQKYFDARCQARRRRVLSFEIERFVQHLQNVGAVKPKDIFAVQWDDLTAQTPSEKLDAAAKMSSINSAALGTGELVFTNEEIRTAAGYEPIPEDPDALMLDDEEDDGEDDEGADPPPVEE